MQQEYEEKLKDENRFLEGRQARSIPVPTGALQKNCPNSNAGAR